MNLSAINLVRMLVAGLVLIAWLPVITRPRGSWLPSIVVSVALVLLLIWHARRARANALALVRGYAFPAYL
jgi:hypothetical protein